MLSGGKRAAAHGGKQHYIAPVRSIGFKRYHRVMPNISCATGLDPAVALFHSLSDPTRLTIVARLAAGEARVRDLVEQTGLAQSTVSAHVACLRDCGLVAGRSEGRQTFYALDRPELMDLLATAETLLAATGSKVALCPNYGRDAQQAQENQGVVR
ncbi:hypothetical protein GCM10009594_13440 [Kocuria palustris]|nr:hypothetical protein Kosp01_24380 [Kocuria sp. NBRC 114282]